MRGQLVSTPGFTLVIHALTISITTISSRQHPVPVQHPGTPRSKTPAFAQNIKHDNHDR